MDRSQIHSLFDTQKGEILCYFKSHRRGDMSSTLFWLSTDFLKANRSLFFKLRNRGPGLCRGNLFWNVKEKRRTYKYSNIVQHVTFVHLAQGMTIIERFRRGLGHRNSACFQMHNLEGNKLKICGRQIITGESNVSERVCINSVSCRAYYNALKEILFLLVGRSKLFWK